LSDRGLSSVGQFQLHPGRWLVPVVATCRATCCPLPPPAARADYRAVMVNPDRPRISCSTCGNAVEQPPLTWMLETDPRRGAVWVCDRCARDNLRAIESKLDRAWW